MKLNRLLKQVIASALLFLLVFAGGGLIPADVVDVFGVVGETIEGDSDLLQAVEAMGKALRDGEDWQNAFVEVFFPVEEQDRSIYWTVGNSYRRYLLPAVAAE